MQFLALKIRSKLENLYLIKQESSLTKLSPLNAKYEHSSIVGVHTNSELLCLQITLESTKPCSLIQGSKFVNSHKSSMPASSIIIVSKSKTLNLSICRCNVQSR